MEDNIMKSLVSSFLREVLVDSGIQLAKDFGNDLKDYIIEEIWRCLGNSR